MKSKIDVYQGERIPESAEAEVLALLRDGDLFRYKSASNSPAAKLEKEFAQYMGVPFALSVNSCSSALFLSLRALGLAPGSRVIIPAFTFAAVPSAIVHAGCVPVLVNVRSDYRIDMEQFYSKIDDNIDAVMISHMRGHTSNMDGIVEACEKRSIPLIEDAAHSLGTRWDGKLVGTFGKIGCFSFQSYKLLNAGEGGMLITEDPDLIARAIIMSGAYEYNWKKHPVVSDRFSYWQNKLPLYNVRMNNLSAVVARSQIKTIDQRAEKGRSNYELVAAILNSSPWLEVPESLEPEVRAPDSIQFNLVGFEDDEQARQFETLAREAGAPVKIIGLASDNARAFWNWEFIEPEGDLSQTRKVLQRACDVRMPVRLGVEELEFVANAIVNAAAEAKGNTAAIPAATLPPAPVNSNVGEPA